MDRLAVELVVEAVEAVEVVELVGIAIEVEFAVAHVEMVLVIVHNHECTLADLDRRQHQNAFDDSYRAID